MILALTQPVKDSYSANMYHVTQPQEPIRYQGRERLHWGLLRGLGRNRFVTSSVLWLFLVPTAAKLLTPFAGEHELTIPWLPEGKNVIHVDIALPFSWVRFYLMAWCFFIGQAVFWLTCPQIVRRYGNFGEYRSHHGENAEKLESMGLSCALRADATARESLCVLVTEKSRRAVGESRALDRNAFALAVMGGIREGHGTASHLGFAFDRILYVEERAAPFWFVVSTSFFGLGLMLLGWVVLESVVAVFRLM